MKAAADAKRKADQAKATADVKEKAAADTKAKANKAKAASDAQAKANKAKTAAVEETDSNEIIQSPLLWSMVALAIFLAIAITLISVFVTRKMKKIRIIRDRESYSIEQPQEPSSMSEIEVPQNNI